MRGNISYGVIIALLQQRSLEIGDSYRCHSSIFGSFKLILRLLRCNLVCSKDKTATLKCFFFQGYRIIVCNRFRCSSVNYIFGAKYGRGKFPSLNIYSSRKCGNFFPSI